MMVDAFRALDTLAQHSRIDPNGIAVMGFSKGAIAAVYSSNERFRKMYGPPNVQFAAHIGLYTPCDVTYNDDDKVTGKALHLHIPETVANLCFGDQQRNRLYPSAARHRSMQSTRACRALFICEKFMVAHVLCSARDYEARSGPATRRMIASAIDMAAALSFAYDIGEVWGVRRPLIKPR